MSPFDVGNVTLTLPSHPSMARVARLTAGALAAVADTSMDELDDIKMLVSEMMTLLTEHGTGGEIELRFTVRDNVIVLDGRVARDHDTPLELDGDHLALCRTVLETVSSSFELCSDDGELRIVTRRVLDPGAGSVR